ncbi:hypothetical protein [Piscinibacter gummiphilus]|uniref:Uncharacterized protein n=1 Tax=Piscinibacter gummiphilus TaxID=946333 RepID=A0A1W6L545_9BURK|nr:hypothetical protein [Piscinibacter gummiphilus]ARN19290.1 hypothetical protein A4W93_04830 [Piscinibacter gummiphilus]ATU63955.1 hypothetical protein CPZ87_04915 [Piscinibacter gummiphilus]GLS93091.1 hypothetical protein GCM10007918_03820 [Piscinibacter gummiphilus]
MPLSPAPFKTADGVDELRHRTRGLSQRHRTVLLLVDGRRPLGEVLGMANKAGAATSHFEELVRLGLVEVPAEVMAPEPQETAPGALDLPKLTSVELDVRDEGPITPPVEPWVLPPIPDVDEPDVEFEVNLAAAAPLVHDEGPDTEGHPDVFPVEAAVAPEPPVPAPMPTPAPIPAPPAAPLRRPPPPVLTTPVADHARPRPAVSEESLRHQVRSLLVGAMGAEAAIFAPLTLTRIRTAQTQRDLIGLVWEIERHRNHLRRSRAQLLSLEKARELLGMGNTLVAGDSGHGAVWPDTHGQG